MRETLKIHDERFEWVKENLGDTLQWLRISNKDLSAWRAGQLVVVSSEAFTPGLRKLPVPVKSLLSLRAEIGGSANDPRPLGGIQQQGASNEVAKEVLKHGQVVDSPAFPQCRQFPSGVLAL